ncbi:hypothetical protein PQX77_017292 [Marasmius sp. AFHP31]|nr:hypothetical protein PQX77_017292 [Marasmius sp. AFHP31]
MPSFRAISLFFVAALATFTAAAPGYTPPTDVNQGGNTGCTTGCPVKTVPDILKKVDVACKPISQNIKDLSEKNVNNVGVVVDVCAKAMADACVDMKELVEAKVGVQAALGVGISIDVVVGLIISIVASIVACIRVILDLKLAAAAQICTSLLVSVQAVIELCLAIFVGVGLEVQLAGADVIRVCIKLALDLNVHLLAILGPVLPI